MQYNQFNVLEAYLIFPKEDILVTVQTKPVRATLRTTLSLSGSKVTIQDIERLEIYKEVTSCVESEVATFQDAINRRVTACVCEKDAHKVTFNS